MKQRDAIASELREYVSSAEKMLTKAKKAGKTSLG
jgi:hypothetical protein